MIRPTPLELNLRWEAPLFETSLLEDVLPEVLLCWAADCADELIQFVGVEAEQVCTECVALARTGPDVFGQIDDPRAIAALDAGRLAVDDAYRVALRSEEAEPERALLSTLTALEVLWLRDYGDDIPFACEHAIADAQATGLTDEWMAGRLAAQMGYPMGRAQVQVALGLLPDWEHSLDELFVIAMLADSSLGDTDPIPVLKEFMPMLIRQAERDRQLEEMLIGRPAGRASSWAGQTDECPF